MSIKLKCKAVRETFKKENYYIIAFEPITPYPNELKLSKYFNFSCCGEYPYITIGKTYEMVIEELKVDRYGTSYKILSVPSLDEQDFHNLSRDEAMEIMLDITSSERIANNILDVYPQFLEIILTDGQDAIDTKLIRGVGDVYLSAYVRNITNKYKYYHIVKKLTEYKIDITDCKNLLAEFKDEDGIKEALKDKPYYVLIEVLSRKFEQVDKMLMEIRPDLEDSEQRCEALMMVVLRLNESEGSSKLNGNILYKYIKNELKIAEVLPLIKSVADNSDIIYYDSKSKDLSIMSTYIGECKVAEFVKEKLSNPHKLNIDWTKYKVVDGFELTDEQSKLLENFCNYDIMIVSGVSGGGKTSSAKSLVRLMDDNKINYCLLAPTGASALRVTSQTQRKCSTIHRQVLKYKEINADVIYIDEMSMVNLETFTMLLNAITNKDAKIILAGDSFQLPAIGVSCVFSDLIKCGKVPTSNLTQVFRYNTSGGSFVGENVRIGKKFLDDDKVKVKDNVYTICNNYKFIQTEDIFENILIEYEKLLKRGYKLHEIMVLSPMNKGSDGTYIINQTIEDEYNPPKPNEQTLSYKRDDVDITFRKGSRIINIKNDYRVLPLESYEILQKDFTGLLTEEDVPTTQLFNGQIGVVRDINEKRMICQFDEEIIVIEKYKLNTILLARAISCHRSQGGEWKCVINVISDKHTRMLSRNLLYVMDTRAMEFVCDIGDRRTFEDSLLIDSVEERDTWLKELMEDE